MFTFLKRWFRKNKSYTPDSSTTSDSSTSTSADSWQSLGMMSAMDAFASDSTSQAADLTEPDRLGSMDITTESHHDHFSGHDADSTSYDTGSSDSTSFDSGSSSDSGSSNSDF